jgi:DNA-binding NarL/FixJ family response regulator
VSLISGLDIAVVDRQPLFRHGLVVSLASQNIRIAAYGHKRDRLVELIRNAKPDILVIDEIGDGIIPELIANDCLNSPTRVIVFLDTSAKWIDVIELRRLGVLGFLDRCARPDELQQALLRVAIGEPFLSERLCNSEPAALWRKVPELSAQDIRILAAVVSGDPLTSIVRDLRLPEGTVRSRLSSLRRILHAKNRLHTIGLLLAPAVDCSLDRGSLRALGGKSR